MINLFDESGVPEFKDDFGLTESSTIMHPSFLAELFSPLTEMVESE